MFLKSATNPLIVSLAEIVDQEIKIVDTIVLELTMQQRASNELFDVIERLLKKHQLEYSELERMYVASGPGSYTGARLLVTIVKTIAFLFPQIAVYDVSILAVLLQMSMEQNHEGIANYAVSYARKNKYYFLDEASGVDCLLTTKEVEQIVGEQACYVNGQKIDKNDFNILDLKENLDFVAWASVSQSVEDIMLYEPYYLEEVTIG